MESTIVGAFVNITRLPSNEKETVYASVGTPSEENKSIDSFGNKDVYFYVTSIKTLHELIGTTMEDDGKEGFRIDGYNHVIQLV